MNLSMAALVGMGRKTVSNMLVTAGLQAQDWTAAYRLFSKERFEPEALFAKVTQEVHAQLEPDRPFVAVIDDTALHKSGKKVHGAAYRRDAMGPKFHTNLVWAQRFLQVAAVLPVGTGAAGARTIPLDFHHAPLPRKPKKTASEEERAAYENERKTANLSAVAVRRIRHLHETLDRCPGGAGRVLWMQGDGGYTNATVLKNLPERTVYTGRIRKDAKLFFLPEPNAKGRKRVYGPQAPTPEAVRQDPAIPWQEVPVYAAGKTHTVRIKTIAPLRSPIAGKTDLRLIAIEPLGYRSKKNSKILYRQPAYLICTDPSRDLQEVVQAYFWRWEIEVNHRDEKNILGVGQVQVRDPAAAARVPAFLVGSYAFALLAAHHVIRQHPLAEAIARPCWQKKGGDPLRPPFQHIVQSMRTELWAHSLGVGHFTGFVPQPSNGTNAKKLGPALAHTVLCSSN